MDNATEDAYRARFRAHVAANPGGMIARAVARQDTPPARLAAVTPAPAPADDQLTVYSLPTATW